VIPTRLAKEAVSATPITELSAEDLGQQKHRAIYENDICELSSIKEAGFQARLLSKTSVRQASTRLGSSAFWHLRCRDAMRPHGVATGPVIEKK
jgi:hypothetical protein